jgi:elongator complex protein 2
LIGHEDWIRDIDVCQINKNQLMIVSSSQDCYIRVWKLTSSELIDNNSEDLSIVENKVKHEIEDDEEEDYLEDTKIEEIKLKSTIFKINVDSNSHVEYSINLESVLYGHEDWVYSVKWQPFDFIENKQNLVFVSASMDKTMVVWKYDEKNAIWLDIVIMFLRK